MGSDYTLSYGTHATADEGRCAMEWVSHLAGEPHGDEPACVSVAVRSFCMSLNDSLPHGPRQLLRPYLARTIGTAGDGLDETRSWMALDWLIRVYAPTWLDAADLTAAAGRVAEIAPVTEPAALRSGLVELQSARGEARAAWSRALGSARPAAWIPWTAGRAVAREAAWGCTGAAAWATARAALDDPAAHRARVFAREIAGDAAALIVRDARTAPAGNAARQALAPTLQILRHSALELLDRMLPTVPMSFAAGEPEPAAEAPITASS